MEYFAGRAATGFAIPEWLPLPDNLAYNRAVAELDEIVYRIIAKRRASPPSEGATKVRKPPHIAPSVSSTHSTLASPSYSFSRSRIYPSSRPLQSGLN